MSEIIIPTLQLIAITGLLYLLYITLLKKRISGNLSRAYLLVGTIAATVWIIFPIPASSATITGNAYLITLPEINAVSINEATQSNPLTYLWWLCAVPSLLLSLRFIANIVRLKRLSNKGITIIINGVKYTEAENIRYPFSFGLHIFLPMGLDEKSKRVIIGHELVHIKHLHTVDVIFFELLKIAAWFNPFYFLIEKELRQAHEFTADEAILKSGYNSQEYCEALLSSAMAGMKVPVNYFKGSQIKTRIYMMNKKKSVGKALVLFIAAASLMIGASATMPHLIVTQITPMQVVAEPDKMPEFPGGNEAMAKFIVDNLKYPEAAKKGKIEGKVVVKFVVDEKGNVAKPEVMRGIGNGCDEEALRVIKAMPTWKPGEKEGKTVAVEMILPIQFKLA